MLKNRTTFLTVGTRYLTTQLYNGEEKKSPSLHLKLSVIAVKRLQAESRENIGVQITKGSQIKTTTNNWMKPLEGIDHSSTKKKCSLCSCWDIFTKLQRVRCVIAVSVCVCVCQPHCSHFCAQTRLTAIRQAGKQQLLSFCVKILVKCCNSAAAARHTAAWLRSGKKIKIMSWCDTVQSTAAAWNEGGYVRTVGIWQFIYKEQTRTCHLAAILCFSCNKFTRSRYWAEIWRLHFLCKSSSAGDEFLYIWGKWPWADRERFADRCARVKAILLRDRFDHCSHTSDEVVQITACLAWSLLHST